MIRYSLYLGGLFGLPCCLVGYSRIAVRIRFSMAGMADAIAFILFVALTGLLLSRISRPWARFLSVYVFTGFLVFFFVGNATYYRFFGDWVHYQIFSQWHSGTEIAGDTMACLTWWDWCVGIAVPIVLAYFIARRPPCIRTRVTCAVLTAGLTAALAFHHVFCQPGFMANDHVAILYFFRNMADRYGMVYLESDRVEAILSNVADYYPPPAEGYSSGTVPDYPLIRVPQGDCPSPLVAIDARRPPNVVLILMESIRAYEMGVYGANPSYTPELDKLASGGLLFRKFYANGTQTIRGELALLCSFYPNLRGGPIYTSYYGIKLSSLPEILRSRGYKTLWISSHTCSSGNKRGFLSLHGINEFHDGEPLRKKGVPQLGWGVSDERMFEYAAEILDRQPQPFFAEIMTVSNHWPFNWPYPTIEQTPPGPGLKMYNDYTRGVYYTDWAVGRFVERMRGKPYFDNTIFVICSDHGFWIFPEKPEPDAFAKTEIYFRSPMIFYAPKLISPGECETLGSQVDFAPTLLHLLGIRHRNAFVGRSLLEPDNGWPRTVLMGHTHRWSLRIGDRYLYDVGPEFFLEHVSSKKQTFDMSDQHVLRECDSDVLRLVDREPERSVSADEKNRLTEWVENLLFMNTYLMEWDRIFDGQ